MAQFDEIPAFLAVTQNLFPDPDGKYEFMEAADDNVMIFFANSSNETKILILYDPD